MRRIRKNKGFTLLELLLTSTLVPIVFLSVYGNFNSGVKIWKALDHGVATEDINILFEKSFVDFENAFKYSGLQFSGDSKKVTFASLIDTDEVLGGDRGIGQISYFYDSGKKVILKEEKNVSQVYKERPGRLRTMLTDVDSFKINFFVYDKLSNESIWQDAWEPEEDSLPVAVRFRFESHLGGEEKKVFTKTFMIPVGDASNE